MIEWHEETDDRTDRMAGKHKGYSECCLHVGLIAQPWVLNDGINLKGGKKK
jgi:hypothetical protein